MFHRSIVNFEFPVNVEEFDNLLEKYTRKKAVYTENDLVENMILDRVIVMDDVSGLAERSYEFANFLTVLRKYGLTFVYIFHTIYPTRQNWQMIMSQTKVFNFFPGSVHTSSFIKILTSFASRYKHNYITNQNLWISQLYYEISNSKQKQFLTIDARDVNKLGSAKFRTQADNGTEQICCYNRNKKNICFNSFLAVRKQTSSPFEINFSIVKVIDNTNRQNDIYSEISETK